MKSKFFKKLGKRWKRVRFSKKLVVFCIFSIIVYTCTQVVLNYRLGIELSPTLTTCVYAFFGTEMAATAAIRIFDREENKSNDSSKEEEYHE